MKTGQITIKDIARELNISPSTVSRALKDHPDISTQTKKAVNSLAKALNYQPNAVALSLRKSKTNTIGVIIPEIVHFFFSTVISGIEDIAYNSGYNVIISQTNESLDREVSDITNMISQRVDGLLVSPSKETDSYDHLRKVKKLGIPLIFFDRICEELQLSQVTVDDYEGAFQATEHLIQQGCKRIAHIAGPPKLCITKNRMQGYKDALKKYEIEIDPALVVSTNTIQFDEGREVVKTLLKSSRLPDGIFTSNDPIAIGAMDIIKKNGLRIPEDIAIIGFSDWQISEFVEPPLSSVFQPGFEMGQTAARLFIEQVADKENFVPKSKVLKTRLSIRQSSRRLQ